MLRKIKEGDAKMKSLEEILTAYSKSKKPISLVYKTHTGMIDDPRNNLVIEKFNKKTGFIQLSHYAKEKKDVTIYTTIEEIARITVIENQN